MVKGTAKMKISSKREGEELDSDGYCTSVTLQNDESSRDAEFQASVGSNESAPNPQPHIQRSSEAGSGQQQNQSHQFATKPSNSSNDSGTMNQQAKSASSSASNPLTAVTQVATGSQPKSSSGGSPMSSHDTQSSNQGTATLSLKPAATLNTSGGATGKQHLESATCAVEASSTSLSTSNVVHVSPNASKTKTSSGNSVQQSPSETSALPK